MGVAAQAGYLNLLVNTLDNFTHGLAIAAAFCRDTPTGITTTIAIVIHEVPHEIGDYAILIQSGFSTSRAIFAQFLTSAGGLLGAVYGLYNTNSGAGFWIFPFVSICFDFIVYWEGKISLNIPTSSTFQRQSLLPCVCLPLATALPFRQPHHCLLLLLLPLHVLRRLLSLLLLLQLLLMLLYLYCCVGCCCCCCCCC
jgi:hypothetical protein